MITRPEHHDLVVIGDEPAGRELVWHAVEAHAARVAVVLEEESALPELDWPEGVELISGSARFLNEQTLQVERSGEIRELACNRFVIATGSKPQQLPGIESDGVRYLDSDSLSQAAGAGRVLVVGGGLDGLRTASLLATTGAWVVLVDRRRRLLEECDADLADALVEHLVERGVDLRLGEELLGVDHLEDDRLAVWFGSEGPEEFDCLVACVGRLGRTTGLDLPAAGLEPDERGRLWCDYDGRTWMPRIFAVGSVIGHPPALRQAVLHGRRCADAALTDPSVGRDRTEPVVLSGTVPEIAQAGRTTEDLLSEGVDFATGRSWSGSVLESPWNLVKLLWDRDDGRLLGVHALGWHASRAAAVGADAISRELTPDLMIATINDPDLMPLFAAAIRNTSEGPPTIPIREKAPLTWRIDQG